MDRRQKLIQERYGGKSIPEIEAELEDLIEGAANAYNALIPRMKSIESTYKEYIKDARIILGKDCSTALFKKYTINHGAGTD